MKSGFGRELSAVAVIFGVLAGQPVAARDWSASGDVSPGVTFTDNVCLSRGNKQSDWIGTLTPSGTVQGKTRRTTMKATGSINLNTLSNSALDSKGCDGNFDDREEYAPRIGASLNTKLLDEVVDLNIVGAADQSDIYSGGRGAGDQFNRTGNTNNYYRYSISPSINRRFMDVANVNMRYSWDEQLNEDERVRDSNRHSLSTSVSNANQSRWSRGLDGRYSVTQYEEDFNGFQQDDTSLSSARFRLGYQFNRKWQVNGYYGWEWNDFQTTLQGDKDGAAWDFGFRYTPSQRTSVSVGQGDRFFGDTPRLDVSHSFRRSTFVAAYKKDIRYERDIRNGTLEGFENLDNLEDDEFDADNPSANSDGVILDERFALGWIYTGRRATISLNGNFSDQTRSEDGEQSTFHSVGLVYSPVLGTDQYTLSGIMQWDQDQPRGSIDDIPELNESGDSQSWTFGVIVGRQINDRLAITMDYLLTDRQSDTPEGEYVENRISANFVISL